MVFTELRFFVFFFVVLAIYWALRGNVARKVLLLVTSYLFYSAWDWRFASLLLVSTVIDHVAAHRLDAESSVARKRRWLVLSLVANLGILGFFKYFNFFVESGVELLGWLRIPVDAPTLAIVLPLGISFYTFQSMSYSIDVYRGHASPRPLLDFAVFVAFFPQLVAGPIVRASDFLPQLETARRWAAVAVRPALTIFLVGYIKKACVADNVAPIVDLYFAEPAAFDAAAAWLAVLLYAVQIYCDFSGYTDMAIGTARLLGYELCLNFDAPYFASSFTVFWRRWHISLSTWLRDYLYIPLGGNRGSTAATYRNLILTMLLGGLWHGAAWTFVVWGAIHGALLAIERALGLVPGRARGFRRALGIVVTFWLVCVAWIFFRADGFGDALVVLRAFVTFHSPGSQSFPAFLFAVFGALAGAHALVRVAPGLVGSWRALPSWGFALVYGCAFAVALAAFPFEYRPFIYFQF
jgi:alginate O-acetyltransferase complex protein AlgI